MKSSGFTLTELLVVISIITILTSISVPVYQGSRSQLALQRAANKMAQDIGRAQRMAMAVKGIGGEVPRGGYGVYFNASGTDCLAYIYADKSDNEKYDPGEEIETLSVEREAKITKIEDLGDLPTNEKEFSINFKPPDPEVKIMKWNPGPAAQFSGDMAITLSLKKDPTSTKSVIVNKSGLIYVK